MHEILKLSNVCKKYQSFFLDHINLTLPAGTIMGLIGPNGAGKSTLIHCILGTISSEGNISVFGKNSHLLSAMDRAKIGVVFDENSLPEHLKAKEVNHILKHIFGNWDEERFQDLLKQLQIPENTAIKELSKGNKVKLNLIAAMSHDPDLLILDEITGVLDPLTRNRVLKLFLEFVQDDCKSILFSSHIVSDIEKIADSVTMLHNGRLIFCKEKEEILSEYRIVKCKNPDFTRLDKNKMIAFKKGKTITDIIIKAEHIKAFEPRNTIIEMPEPETLMSVLAEGELV